MLRGLKEVFEEGGRGFAASFTVERRETQMFVAQGRVAGYRPPEPMFTAEAEVAEG